ATSAWSFSQAQTSVDSKNLSDQCISCHNDLGTPEAQLFQHDIHRAKGISCADCHGGNRYAEDMEQAMDKKAGYIGVPKGDQISETCAKCHSDETRMKHYQSSIPTNQFENLKESVHGALDLSGNNRIVQCTTCHNAHGIVSVENPVSPVYPLNVPATCGKCHSNPTYMRAYNPSLPVDQLEKYRTSIHGVRNKKGDPKTAECASCHGSHDIKSVHDAKASVYPLNIPATCAHCHSNAAYMKQYKIPTDQFEQYSSSVHGVALLKKHDLSAPACNGCHGNHGAVPPGVESISKVCGTCHALNADLFSSSPHKKAFDERNLPECETCHSNHEILTPTEKMIGTAADAICSRCHSEKENPKGYVAAGEMRGLIDSLIREEAKARVLVNEAVQRGMEVSDAEFKLRDAHQALLQSRTAIHAFNEEKFAETVKPGLATAALVQNEAQGAVDEYYFRRTGLGVATLIITILAVSLFLYIRRIEKNGKSEMKL
ncbi:MAG: ammonia-forming cytochrome c nitrite reductase subunit c552, partial [Bacteroidota bacterium]|nr:ammonia-forming cytochrome c nitrite reductase subunit c552 [Bacteroidota bacterium]